MRKTMHDPRYARRIWDRFRARRPLGCDAPPMQIPAAMVQDAERIKDELAEVFLQGSQVVDGPADPPDQPQDQGDPIMIRLNAGVSRKVGQPNYGSRGASVNVELELESTAAQDPQLLHDRIRRLFALARDAVNEELGTNGQANEEHPRARQNGPNGGSGSRPATEAQIRAIKAICTKLGRDPEQEAHSRFGRDLTGLRLREASSLIDELKAQTNGQ